MYRKTNEKLTFKNKTKDLLQGDIKSNTKKINSISRQQTWININGWSSHISNCKDLFIQIKSTKETIVVTANGNVLSNVVILSGS